MSWDDLSDQLAEIVPFSGERSLLPIIGDGIHPVSLILSDHALKLIAPNMGVDPLNAHDFVSFHWAHYEAARNYTAYYLPDAALAILAAFIHAGAVRDLVTTNYDLFLDGIWERCPELRVVRNPVLTTDEYGWDGYYSSLPATPCVRFWKIHGSLSHGFFAADGASASPIICRLPAFAIGSAHNDNILHIKLEYPFPYLGYYAHTLRGLNLPKDRDVDKRLLYYIDWNFPGRHREPFRREIEGAMGAIRGAEKKVVLLLGFSGFFDESNPNNPRNEELVPLLLDLLTRNTNIYMALTEDQYARVHDGSSHYPLATKLETLGNLISFPKYNTFYFTRYLLRHPGLYALRRWASYRYLEWSNYYYRRGKEPGYVHTGGA